MSGDLRHINNAINSQMGAGKKNTYRAEKTADAKDFAKELPLVHESCNASGWTMAAVAGALMLFAGILLYAIVI